MHPGDVGFLRAGVGGERDPAHLSAHPVRVRGGAPEHGERLAQTTPVHPGRRAAGVGGARRGGESAGVLAGGPAVRR
ncbi:hypothetical protein [Kitasatospora griseola]|uniref:hypothetical protein n=1 Tax=Kitasatospora griseola TaxID=2064 RepID=UPI00342C8EEB